MTGPSNPVRLCPIYLRDALSFLSYMKLQDLRGLSRSVYSTITYYRRTGSLPVRKRHIYMGMGVTVADRGTHYTKAGYMDERYGKRRHRLNASAWHKLACFDECCKEALKPVARRLAGECIIPNHAPDSTVEISLNVLTQLRWVKFRARNEMTEETAFGLVHLLKHLNECALERGDAGAFNPVITDWLRREGGGRLRALATVDGLSVQGVAHLKIQEALWQLEEGEGSAGLLDFIQRGGANCKTLRIELEWTLNDIEVFDQMLQHFVSTTQCIGKSPVREVLMLCVIPIDTDWPTQLPPRKEMEKRRDSPGGLTDALNPTFIYRHRLSNQHSGEWFFAQVTCVIGLDGEEVRELRMVFGG